MFAELYSGPPIASTDLEIGEEDAIVTSDGRVQVSFSRPLVGGYLAKQMVVMSIRAKQPQQPSP